MQSKADSFARMDCSGRLMSWSCDRKFPAGLRNSLAHMDCEGESCPWTLTLNDTCRSQPTLLCCEATGVRYIANCSASQSDCG